MKNQQDEDEMTKIRELHVFKRNSMRENMACHVGGGRTSWHKQIYERTMKNLEHSVIKFMKNHQDDGEVGGISKTWVVKPARYIGCNGCRKQNCKCCTKQNCKCFPDEFEIRAKFKFDMFFTEAIQVSESGHVYATGKTEHTFPADDVSNKGGECPVCLETKELFKLNVCKHEICKNCFVRIGLELYDDLEDFLCPLCRRENSHLVFQRYCNVISNVELCWERKATAVDTFNFCGTEKELKLKSARVSSEFKIHPVDFSDEYESD